MDATRVSFRSVDENEDDEPNARDRLLKDHDAEANGPPVKFTWKQRILVCIGLADPEKLKEQMEEQRDAQEDEKMQTVFRTRPPRRGLALEPLEEVIQPQLSTSAHFCGGLVADSCRGTVGTASCGKL